MRYVIAIVIFAVYGLWDISYYNGAHTRLFVAEVERVYRGIF
jgi:hypothetical protein